MKYETGFHRSSCLAIVSLISPPTLLEDCRKCHKYGHTRTIVQSLRTSVEEITQIPRQEEFGSREIPSAVISAAPAAASFYLPSF